LAGITTRDSSVVIFLIEEFGFFKRDAKLVTFTGIKHFTTIFSLLFSIKFFGEHDICLELEQEDDILKLCIFFDYYNTLNLYNIN
jgi:hypothetical protein